MNVKYLVATTWNRSAAALGGDPERFRLVFSDASVRVFENRTVLPRAFLVPASSVEIVPGEDAQLARICSPDFDPSRSVVLPEALRPSSESAGGPAESARVFDVVANVNEVRLSALAGEPCVLVVSQTHYPGWKAYVDGAPAALLRADYAFDGVALSPGRHTVRLALEPTSLRIGVLITLASLVVVGVLVWPRRPH
jgi:hypothetical protein